MLLPRKKIKKIKNKNPKRYWRKNRIMMDKKRRIRLNMIVVFHSFSSAAALQLLASSWEEKPTALAENIGRQCIFGINIDNSRRGSLTTVVLASQNHSILLYYQWLIEKRRFHPEAATPDDQE